MDSFWAAAPKGPMTYTFTHGEISPSPPSSFASSPNTQISASRPKSQLQGPSPSQETQIQVSKPKSHPWGPLPIFEAQIPTSRPRSQPHGLNPSLDAQIPVLLVFLVGPSVHPLVRPRSKKPFQMSFWKKSCLSAWLFLKVPTHAI